MRYDRSIRGAGGKREGGRESSQVDLDHACQGHALGTELGDVDGPAGDADDGDDVGQHVSELVQLLFQRTLLLPQNTYARTHVHTHTHTHTHTVQRKRDRERVCVCERER